MRLALASTLVSLACLAACEARAARSLVLITLDTTRADALGCYGAKRATPALDSLAGRGLRYTRALSASPLTLPSHASLLSGLEPPEHGVLDNGTAVLPGDVPTLASVLAARGYSTAAFVGSRVLDRRFGLARGFEHYGDRMAAERTGEFGYAERGAAAVADEALAWLAARPAGKPFFVWLHFYDAHAPYAAPGKDDQERYLAEVAGVDAQLARVFLSLPAGADGPVIAAAGDHGEAFGEHGERGHGLLLHEAVLRVPLILAGPGVPAGQSAGDTVGTRRLAATLLALLDAPGQLPGPPLPGLPRVATQPSAEPGVYSETWLPASAYGWSALQSLSGPRLRLVEAPRLELYDVLADPSESRNLAATQGGQLSRARRELRELLGRLRVRAGAEPDAEAQEGVRALGYLSGASGTRSGRIDPKDGLALLAEWERAKELLARGQAGEAARRLADLCKRSPGNVPFLSQLANAQLAQGQPSAALQTLQAARELNPRSELLLLRVADAQAQLGQGEAARAEYEQVLKIDPRDAAAFLGLADLASGADAERAVLERALQAGTSSSTLLARLAGLELAAGRKSTAERHLLEAIALMPEYVAGWTALGALAEGDGRLDEALGRYQRAVAADPADAQAQLHLRRLLSRLRK